MIILLILLLLCIGPAVITCLAPCVTLGQIAEIVDEGATSKSFIQTQTFYKQRIVDFHLCKHINICVHVSRSLCDRWVVVWSDIFHWGAVCLLMHVPGQNANQIWVTGCSGPRLDHSLIL